RRAGGLLANIGLRYIPFHLLRRNAVLVLEQPAEPNGSRGIVAMSNHALALELRWLAQSGCNGTKNAAMPKLTRGKNRQPAKRGPSHPRQNQRGGRTFAPVDGPAKDGPMAGT